MHKSIPRRRQLRRRRVSVSAYLCLLLCFLKLYHFLQRYDQLVVPDFVVIGFYEGKVPCEALISTVLADVNVLLLDTSKYRGVSDHVKRTRALRDLILTKRTSRLKPRSFRQETVVLSIDLGTVSFRRGLNLLRGVSSELHEQLRRGSVFVPLFSNSTNNFLGLLKHVRKTQQYRKLDKHHDFFCPSHLLNECPRALVVTYENAYENAQVQKSRLDSGTMFEALSEIERSYQKQVQSCMNITMQMDREKSMLNEPLHHFLIGSELESLRNSSAHQHGTEHTSVDSVRVQAWTGDEVARLIDSQKVLLPRDLKQNTSLEFLRKVACTVTHLTAIYMAYASGANHACVTEDSVILPSDFKERLEHALSKAPNDWETLQLAVVNPRVANVVTNLYATSYIKWYPTHTSSAAYMISRQGMVKVLQRWGIQPKRSRSHSRPTLNWIFPADGVYHADESIFYPTRSYTYCQASPIHIPSGTTPSPLRRGTNPKTTLSTRLSPNFRMLAPDSLLMISSLRVKQIADYERNIVLLMHNFREVRKSVRSVSMRVSIVCVNDVIALAVNQRLSNEITEMDQMFISVSVNPLRFNKFMFVAIVLPHIHSFESVMLLDSDMDLRGFPLMEYFELTASYVVSGTVHQNVDEMLSAYRNKPSRQWFKIFEGSWWEHNAPQSLLMESKLVEQGFAVLDAHFAGWYFSKILTTKHLMYANQDGLLYPRESDFGPDLLWCGAAVGWLKSHNILSRIKPCAFSTFPVYHTDDRQLGFDEISDPKLMKERNWIQRRPLKLFEEHFPQWFAYSAKFARKVGGHVHTEDGYIQYLLDHSIRCIRCVRT